MRKRQRKEDMYNELLFCYALDGNVRMQELIQKRIHKDGIQTPKR